MNPSFHTKFWLGMHKYIHINDPVEIEFAGRLQMSTLAHVGGSSSRAYVGSLNSFFLWWGSLMMPRRPLPVDDLTVSLYFQSLMDKAMPHFPMRFAVGPLSQRGLPNVPHAWIPKFTPPK
jgi:hypothetical protein